MPLPERLRPIVVPVLAAGFLLSVTGCDGLRRAGESRPAPQTVSEEDDSYEDVYAAEDSSYEESGYDEAGFEEPGDATEAGRTRAMEAKADEMRAQYEEAVANATTDEERLRAYQEFEANRRQLNELAEDEEVDEFGPPPTP